MPESADPASKSSVIRSFIAIKIRPGVCDSLQVAAVEDGQTRSPGTQLMVLFAGLLYVRVDDPHER